GARGAGPAGRDGRADDAAPRAAVRERVDHARAAVGVLAPGRFPALDHAVFVPRLVAGIEDPGHTQWPPWRRCPHASRGRGAVCEGFTKASLTHRPRRILHGARAGPAATLRVPVAGAGPGRRPRNSNTWPG